MKTLIAFESFSVGAFLAALALLIFIRLLTGGISLKGLLDDKFDNKAGEQALSVPRLQLLLASIAAAGDCLWQVMAQPDHLPMIPPALLLVLGGSQGGYLLSKGIASYQSQQRLKLRQKEKE